MNMLVTDLDGTLLPRGGEMTRRDLRILHRLGQKGIVRVIATGRNLYSLNLVLPGDFPVDYVIFSSGAGILKWPERKLLFRSSMGSGTLVNLLTRLDQWRLDHMVHRRVPHNHWFWYRRFTMMDTDFSLRLKRYRAFARSRPRESVWTAGAVSQVLVIIPPEETRLAGIRHSLESRCQVIRTTSPLDNRSIWIELFPRGVSKASGVREIGRMHGIPFRDTVAVGNDFNDLDMLRKAGTAMVTADAPALLRREFPVLKKNAHGLMAALLGYLNEGRPVGESLRESD